jgi:tetratricopeptide (TPR) repeat protein
MTVLYFVLRETTLNFGGFFDFYAKHAAAMMPLGDRIVTFLATLPSYLQMLIWPTDLHMERGFPVYSLNNADFLAPQVVAGVVILAAIITGTVRKPSKPATPLAWGLLWAVVVHIPQSGIFVTNDALIYEHWLYLPTMGLALGLGETLARVPLPQYRHLMVGLAAIIAATFGSMTYQQNEIWRDPVTFYNHIFDCGEDSPRAHDMLGNVYTDNGHYDLAIEQYRHVANAGDANADAHYKFGMFIVSFNPTPTLLAEAVEHFNRALQINPDYYKADDALAVVAATKGDLSSASTYRTKAVVIKERLGVK